MKLSLAWIFDHIQGDVTAIDVPRLITLLTTKTAEIESFKKVTVDPGQFGIALVEKVGSDVVVAMDIADKKTFKLPLRDDLKKGDHALIMREKSAAQWMKMSDFGGSKDSVAPAIYFSEKLKSTWQQNLEKEDYILEINNTAITHRPDLWCARGFAREVSALLDLPLIPVDGLLATKVIKNVAQEAPGTVGSPIMTRIENPTDCRRFASLYFDFIEPTPSLLWMVQRLSAVDSKPINFTVDATNYVMFDIGQPMHAYDSQKLTTKTVAVRSARAKESITLLDGTRIDLQPNDLLIVDGDKPIGLAGIMGGASTGVTGSSQPIFLESANFAPTVIRKTAARIGLRTEASARFEKNIDPNLNTVALLRFLKLLETNSIHFRAAEIINSLGERAREHEITLTHEFIESRLGIKIAPEFVQKTLEKLEFKVRHDAYAKQLTYIITVPTFRGTKDVTIKEDIVEEVGRYFGYDAIPLTLPTRSMDYFDLGPIMHQRAIKQLCSQTLAMRELYNYSLFDESYLHVLEWQPKHAVTIKNPVSENWQRMVTTLVPGLLKAIDTNKTDFNSMRFFEMARVWHLHSSINEKKTLAGIFFEQKKTVDFYEAKVMLMKLFDMFAIDVIWEKVSKPDHPWFAPYQTAYILHKGNKIGIAGKINSTYFARLAEGDAFIFELDADFLLSFRQAPKIFESIAKYPGIHRDISIFIPSEITAHEVEFAIKNISPLVASISLIDHFEKADMPDKRSLTFHCLLQDPNKTLTSQEADLLWNQVINTVEKLGAKIR